MRDIEIIFYITVKFVSGVAAILRIGAKKVLNNRYTSWDFFNFCENESIYTPLFIPCLQVGIPFYVFMNCLKPIEI